MNKKTNDRIEKKILELSASGMTKKQIAEIVGLARSTVFEVLKKYRVPDEKIEVKKIKTFKDIINLRLLYFCKDLKLLTRMFVAGYCSAKPEKIYVTKRMDDLVGEKIKKIVYLAEHAGLNCQVEYVKQVRFK